MNELEEIKSRVLAWYRYSDVKSLAMITKLLEGEEFTLQEVDDLHEAIGKYHAFVLCLRRHAKAE